MNWTFIRYAILNLLPILLLSCVSVEPMTPDKGDAVVTVENHSLSQDDAFTRLAWWAAETFVDENEGVRLSDEKTGTLVLKGTKRVHHLDGGAEYPLGFSLTIEVRDQRVRFTQKIGEPHISPSWSLSSRARPLLRCTISFRKSEPRRWPHSVVRMIFRS